MKPKQIALLCLLFLPLSGCFAIERVPSVIYTITAVTSPPPAPPDRLEDYPYGDIGDSTFLWAWPLPIIVQQSIAGQQGEWPETAAVYADPYPTDHGGPLYAFTAALAERSVANAAHFLEVLYGAPGPYSVSTEGFFSLGRVSYEDETVFLSAGPADVGISTADFGLPEAIEAGELLENPAVLAAISFLGLTDPVVADKTQYHEDGSVGEYRFRITEKAASRADAAYQKSFQGVSLSLFPQSEQAGLGVYRLDAPVKVREEAAVPFERALAHIQGKYGASAECIHVAMEYRRNIAVGYYLPCYAFYIEQEATGEGAARYLAVYVPMVLPPVPVP